MVNEQIQEGAELFVSDADKSFGCRDRVSPHGRRELVVHVENAGDLTVMLSTIKAVHSQKVIVECDRLDQRLRKAIGRARDTEDPRIEARS